MPTTGVDFDKIIDWKGGRNYSAYFPPTQKNATIKEATIKYIDFLYATNDKQRIADELFGLYKTESVFTPVLNQLYLNPQTPGQPNTVTDYDHIVDLFVYQVEDLAIYITDTTIASPIKVTFNREANLRTGDQLKITGVLGNIAANGIRYINMVNKTQCLLYTDPKLTNPVTGNFPYGGGGTAQRYVGSWAQNARQKTSSLGSPALFYPQFEAANGFLKILPKSIAVSSVVMDYVSKPTVFIDVANNVVDLELTYSYRCITGIAEETNRLLGRDSRDKPLENQSQSEIMLQP